MSLHSIYRVYLRISVPLVGRGVPAEPQREGREWIRREGVDGADVPSEFRLQDSTFDIFFSPVYAFAHLHLRYSHGFDGLCLRHTPRRPSLLKIAEAGGLTDPHILRKTRLHKPRKSGNCNCAFKSGFAPNC